MSEEKPTLIQKALAWSVHGVTASGVFLALLSLTAMTRGNYHYAFLFLSATIIIDSIDGTLARLFRVKEVVPQFDGALLDNIIDFLTYAFIPGYFVLTAGFIEAPWSLIAAGAILLSSCYQFCQTNAKTDDHYFLGFPDYWNIVVLYLYWMRTASTVSFWVVMVFTVLVFIPLKYIYPSRTKPLMKITLPILIVWTVGLTWAMIWRFDNPPQWFILGSLGVFGYYFLASYYLNLKTAR